MVKKAGLVLCLTLALITSLSALSAQGRRGQRGARGVSDALPGGTVAHRDLAYAPNGHTRQKLDLYLPKGNKTVPLIIFIHGGAFTRGDKRDQSPAPFVSDGYAFASLNYRLSQDAIFRRKLRIVKRQCAGCAAMRRSTGLILTVLARGARRQEDIWSPFSAQRARRKSSMSEKIWNSPVVFMPWQTGLALRTFCKWMRTGRPMAWRTIPPVRPSPG